NDVDAAAEYFAISPQEQKIILTPRAAKAWQKKYWGDDGAAAEVPVSVFLRKSGATYAELFELLQCDFVNGTHPESAILCPADNCDLDAQKVENLSMDRLDRMNRFLRLWKKTGLKLWELDLLLMQGSVGKGVLDGAFLIQLRKFEELRKMLKLNVEECAALFGAMNTRLRRLTSSTAEQPKNLFENLFLSGSVDAQTSADFRLLLSDAETSKSLEPYRAHILSRLSLSSDEWNALLPLTTATLSRESLSVLFRYKALASKLKLKLDDFLVFCRVAGIADPFASPDSVRGILEKKQMLADAGISLPQLSYVLEFDDLSPAGWREEVYIQKIQGLRESLADFQGRLRSCEEAGGDTVDLLLSMLTPFADSAARQAMLDIIGGVWPGSQSEITDFITGHLGPFLADPSQAVEQLKYTAPPSPAEVQQRRSYVTAELLVYLNRTAIKEFTAAAFGLESSQASVLLDRLHLPGSSDSILGVLQDPKLHAADGRNGFLHAIAPADLPEIFSAFRLLHKASVAAQRLGLDADELAWFIDHPSAGDTLGFNALPIEASQGALPLESLLNLWRFLRFRRLFPEPENASLISVLQLASDPGSSAQAVNEALCRLTGWDPIGHEDLHHVGLNYRRPETYEWFLECHRQMKIAGADAAALAGLASRDLPGQEEAAARKARGMAQAKYTREQWLKTLKPIMDDLREKKRKALTAFLVERSQREKPAEITVGGRKVGNPEYWTSSDDLYGWFLVDAEMCADQLTSRILQATLSTQLFVQRCFLNLEKREVEVALPDPDIENGWDQWKWMKNYRIWEANRKVFLYPENWIEPELRDGKSPFFEELESDLLSTEATGDRVEAALQRYIQKLEEVSRLGVCGIFHEKDGPENLLHVVGRTRSVPAVFYYRSYDLNYSRWSAWEKIEADIQSDHVVPWVYNRKLHLFWLNFQEKPIKLKKLPPVKASEVPGQN
ncbi:MAG TPA: neuraminidase-like domain-containing protein, partial [Thermodesulfobacteriota bacterium]|nr:neuraminidase-like domain-containing protein [Thermodesulfobacteriota bacterium]